MKAMKRLAALSLSAAMALTGCGKKEEKSSMAETGNIINGTFTYLSGGTYTADFYYTDDYFSASGKLLNEHLRTTSFDLTLTAFGSSSDDSSANAREFLSAVGFSSEDFVSADMDGTPTRDTIGTVISHKATPFGEVIAVGVRGANYGSEWANNFLSGETGDAKGFSDSAQKVISRIRDYEEEYGLSGAKIWITGYSRGGAVSDLAGKYINEHLDEFGITDDDLYVYTFEAPRASGTAAGYANIHNVSDANDLIARVYPESWGFSNAGTPDHILGEDVEIQPMALDLTDGLATKELSGDPTTVQEFEAEFLSFLDECVTREEFSSYGDDIGTVITLRLTREGDDDGEEFNDLLAGAIGGVFNGGSMITLMALYTSDRGTPEYDAAIKSLSSMIADNLDAADHSGCLSEEEYAQLKDALPSLVAFLTPVIIGDMTHNSVEPFAYLGTFIGNFEAIFTRHDPAAVLAALEELDSYHNS